MTKYLGVAETGALIRQVLKESFGAAVKFSVKSRSYSGGGSVSISWKDGPTSAMVKQLVSVFEGAYFDGMIDYEGDRFARLDGEEVRFGASYVFTCREYSDGAIYDELALTVSRYGVDLETMPDRAVWPAEYRSGRLGMIEGSKGGGLNYWSVGDIAGRGLAETSFVSPSSVKQSPTRARVEFAGDDGYGRGTVGRNGEGGENCYKAVSAALDRNADAIRAGIGRVIGSAVVSA